MKRLLIMTATAALALSPQAALAKKPQKTKDRDAKVERTKKDTAQQRCREERKALGTAAFAAKYGKARTKGSEKAKAKAARASFGRCVSQTAKLIRSEREAAEAAEEEALEAEEELADGQEGEDVADGEDVVLDGDEPLEHDEDEPLEPDDDEPLELDDDDAV